MANWNCAFLNKNILSKFFDSIYESTTADFMYFDSDPVELIWN